MIRRIVAPRGLAVAALLSAQAAPLPMGTPLAALDAAPAAAAFGDYAATIHCGVASPGVGRSCRAWTENRVRLVRDLSGRCREGRTWTYDAQAIRTSGGCVGQFAFGYAHGFGGSGGSWQQGGGFGGSGGSAHTHHHQHGHNNSGAMIAGGMLAAGLVAALAAANRPSTIVSNDPAGIDANLNLFPDRSRDEARACLAEAARQVGWTGGSHVRLDRVLYSEPQPGGGWRHEAMVVKEWPGHRDRFVMDCVAMGSEVLAFDIR